MEFIGTQQQWNEHVIAAGHAQFLQSYEWGIFQKALGRNVWYLGGGNTKEQVQCLTIKYPLKGKWFYLMCPRGPVGVPSVLWWKEYEQWAISNEGLFSRIEPVESLSTLSALHVRDVEPSHTRILNLSKTEKELLSEMHSKTRYNSNLSQKKGVIVTTKKYSEIKEEDIKQWWSLSQETASRNNISVHPQEYYKTLFTTFPYITIYKAIWQDTIVAMTVMVGFGDSMYYLYGASTQIHKEIMAPYLLQWQAIIDAKKDGYHYYDFWGVAPHNNPSHPLAGVTRFKKGFGGEIVSYPGTFDIPLRTIPYKLYTFLRTIKRSL